LQRATLGLIYRFITHTDLSALEQATDKEETSTVATANDDSESEDESAVSHSNNNKGNSKAKSLLTSYLESITRIRMIILAQSRSVWFLLPRWCYTTFAALYRAEEETMEPIREMAAQACERAKNKSPLRLLQKLPQYASRDGFFSKNLLDEAITLLFAGQDTSAATLSWTLHLLTVYPEVQAKLAREVCREMDDGRPVTKKLISRMPYLDAVIKESMRLYPVAPFVVRKVANNVDIAAPESGFATTEGNVASGLSLPAGSLACIWIYSLHRNPEFWNQPERFIPERWLRDDDDSNRGSSRDRGITTPGAYMPFAAGSRNCVGQPLANVILRTLLARLVHRYEFRDERVVAAESAICSSDESLHGENSSRSDPKAKFRKDMQAGFTVLPQGGLSLEISLRKDERGRN